MSNGHNGLALQFNIILQKELGHGRHVFATEESSYSHERQALTHSMPFDETLVPTGQVA